MRRRLNMVRDDVETRELAEMLDQPVPSDAAASDDESINSEDERDPNKPELPDIPWY